MCSLVWYHQNHHPHSFFLTSFFIYVTCSIHNILQKQTKKTKQTNKETYPPPKKNPQNLLTHKKLSFLLNFELIYILKVLFCLHEAFIEENHSGKNRLNVKFITTQGKWLLTFNINMSSCAAIKSHCVTIQLRCSRH